LLDGPFADVPVGFKVSRQSFDLGVSTLKKLGIISSSSSLAYDDVVIPSARADG